MKKLYLIVNPCSGKQKTSHSLADIVSVFNRADYDVTVYITAERGDATKLVQARGSEFDLIVCAGGDGTFNEVITGLHAGGHITPLGYLPAGSTNDFATGLHLSKDLVQAAHDIVEGVPHKLDIGRFNGSYFSYIASFGAFTRTSYATPQSLKNALGHLAYILAGAKEITAIHSYHLRVTLADGTSVEDDYIFGAVSNCTSVAGILTLDPALVDMNDGKLEVLLIRRPKNPIELAACVTALLSQRTDAAMMTFLSSEHIEFEAPEDMDWTLDGEHCFGSSHCVVEDLHDAIQLISRADK